MAADRFKLNLALARLKLPPSPPAFARVGDAAARRPPTDEAVRAALRARAGAARREIVGLGLLWLVALALRLPGLRSAPPTPDEAREVARALDLVRSGPGELARLALDPTALDGGPLAAVVFGLAVAPFGPGVEAARLATAILGAAVAPLAYLLAREVARPLGRRRLEDGFLGPRLAGLVAALLLATSAAQVVLGAQAARAASLAPPLVLGGFFALERALGTRDGRWLAPGGLLLGLALQAAPLAVAALLPGAACAIWRAGRPLLRERTGGAWAAAGLGALLLGAGPVLAAVARGGPSWADPGDGAVVAHAGYPEALAGTLATVHRLLAGRLAEDASPVSSVAWACAALALLGLAILALRGRPLLPLAATGALLALPALLRAPLDPLAHGHALLPLVALGLVAAGVAVGTLAPLTARRGSLARLLLVVALAALVLAPLGGLPALGAR